MCSWVAAAGWRRASCSALRSGGGRPPPGSLSDLLQSSVTGEDTGTEAAARRGRRLDASSVLLFPGQGSQRAGMGRGLLSFPGARDLFVAARDVLGYDLLSLCLHGPQTELDRTVHCQPAVFVSSLAAVEKLSHQRPDVIENCVAAAGFSVGEFAALVFAGALDFEAALYAVKVRAEAMQQASEAVPSGMLSIIGQPKSDFKVACIEAREHCRSLGVEDPVCEVANYLFPDSRVVAGHLQALKFLEENSRKYYFARTKMLPVSGAFHTRLMESAIEPLAKVLKSVEIRKPLINVYSNVDGKKYMHSKHIQHLLVKQLVSPVKWEQTMHEVYERTKRTKFPFTYEVGPGKQLGAMLRNCNLKAWRVYKHIEVSEDEEVEEA
ncbi:malonyl-CoA-acyl carrier protein transacylase, mitochondrial isoform X1 [Alligator mississippiensis]|nr:malonyl-CoA-acyl carrier protein transacylase, mitochondrial isoform X1 [Alligator mississippiensis]